MFVSEVGHVANLSITTTTKNCVILSHYDYCVMRIWLMFTQCNLGIQ